MRETVSARRWSALVLLCSAEFVNVLGVTVLVVALPSIGRSLELSGAGLRWVASAYALLFGGFLMVSGRAADLYGRRRAFVAGLTAFAAASLASGLAPSGTVLILARGAQGLGAAMTVPAALAMLSEIFPEGTARDRAVGVWTAVAAGGGAAGFFLGGVLTEAVGWRWVLLLNVPVAVTAALLAPLLLGGGAGTRGLRHLDLPGAVTGTGGLLLLIYAFTRAEQAGFGDPGTLGSLAAASLLILLFLRIERRAANPLVPPGVFRLPNLSGGASAAFALTAATSPAAVLGTLYLQGVLDYSPTATGLAYVPWSLAVIGGSLIGARLAGRIGAKATVASGLLAVTAAMLIASGISVEGGLPHLVAALLLSGAGLGCASVPATSLGVSAVADGERGLASGLLTTAAQVGTALGIAALLALAAAGTGAPAGGGPPSAGALVQGYRYGYLAAAGVSATGLLTALYLIRRPPGEGREPQLAGRRPRARPPQRPKRCCRTSARVGREASSSS
jgi:MFS family permease